MPSSGDVYGCAGVVWCVGDENRVDANRSAWLCSVARGVERSGGDLKGFAVGCRRDVT
jgi:hypothetical protein